VHVHWVSKHICLFFLQRCKEIINTTVLPVQLEIQAALVRTVLYFTESFKNSLLCVFFFINLMFKLTHKITWARNILFSHYKNEKYNFQLSGFEQDKREVGSALRSEHACESGYGSVKDDYFWRIRNDCLGSISFRCSLFLQCF